jgi:hypothetical protein
MTSYQCFGCRLDIIGEYLTVRELGNRKYHPDCFLCYHCRQEIQGSFLIYDNQPYHSACLSERQGLWCAGCGELITGEYLTALDKKWHPHHFVCTKCRKPIVSKSYPVKDGKPYCASCYQDTFLPRCTICGHPIAEKYIQNRWGDTYCASHEREYKTCACCQRLVTRGGVLYKDGRSICQTCRSSAVDNLNTAWSSFNKVRRHLARLGINLVNAAIPLELVDQRRIPALSARLSVGDTFGVTSKSITTRLGVPVEGKVEKISILHGLPRELFTAVSAHELGHAWLCLNNIQIHVHEIEEGFCELLGYLWLESLGTPTSRIWMKGMLENQNTTYSSGLKMALRSYKEHSLPSILSHLRSTSHLP